jgi:hypothetical protein
MKKKKKITKAKRKQKIDVVIESLVHLEQRVKELIKKIDESNNNSQPIKVIDTNSNPKWDKKYWPNTHEPPFKYKDIMWNDNSSSQWDAIDKGLQ